jgi:hypothetical protein
VLEAAGRVGDRALLWAVPRSELDRTVSLVARGAAENRRAGGASPALVWAPLVPHDEPTLERIRGMAAYAVLNSPPSRKAAWGLAEERVAEIRRVLVGGGALAAADLIPAAALDDLVLADPSAEAVGADAARLGVTGIGLPVHELDSIGSRVEWARRVVAVARERASTTPVTTGSPT